MPGDSGNLVYQTSSAKRMRIDVGTKVTKNVRKEMAEIEEALEQLDMQSASARKTRRERRAEAHEQFEKENQVSIDKVKAMEALKDDEVARKEKARAEYIHEQTELQNEQNHLDHLNSQIKNDELMIEGFKRE
ncbi:hypothetical protein PRIPAC_97504 [Pristionchus pacificus]|uniref:Uncharacterized protein n=1 Tax=Pristionchus pacificus TaxID=54126 RepID=A0A2A6B356_PRIPA|nr:hypothetical protein PRIPAC_97504 [Pristionchus pacificus]|eukprot:PDM60302.1 hypothetical protein PRIPAC_54127 [Pristionchus pacificus]